jgi:hypothetical protein
VAIIIFIELITIEVFDVIGLVTETGQFDMVIIRDVGIDLTAPKGRRVVSKKKLSHLAFHRLRTHF